MVDRVQKILREWGVASRREAERMILAGKVKVNGHIIALGDKANPARDKIEVEGKVLSRRNRPQLVYILLNKPRGVISTCDDPKKRETVLDLLNPELQLGQGIHPVGRLDRDSTGALILSNDGDFTLSLTHPRYHLPKTYQVWLRGSMPDDVIKKWSDGFMWEGKQTLPAPIVVKKRTVSKTLIEIVLSEGRNRQIRRIADLFGYPVISLHRSAIAFIRLGNLKIGESRFLTAAEVNKLSIIAHKGKK
ncbi:ribosomal large subunit pseudouridine synthase B [Cyanobacterium stanieri PCC 7202]|uniref:Pseudouridine synthase n=1 Tax=Cyanobacterium stanieri (strain ATCC 29140 / PCC 7202) TaxID=292563 RepID=K9YK47_CYASC|nr:ribosomal large subunit pseudouridine synthase B [Cyanobacterium stanieri PCC 7202]